MPIQYSFTDSARRLLVDAFALWEHGTHETAAHLAGLSAECVLKSILVGLGVAPVDGDGQLKQKRWKIHVHLLWNEFQSQLAGRGGAAYLALLPTSVPGPFISWDVNHRYVAAKQLADADLERWMLVAISMRALLNHAISNGEAQ